MLRLRTQRGSALTISLIMTLIFATLAGSFVLVETTQAKHVAVRDARFQARAAAIAGLQRALVELDDSCSTAGVCSHVAAGDAAPCFGNIDGVASEPRVRSGSVTNGVVNRVTGADTLDLAHRASGPDGWIDFRDEVLASPGTALSPRDPDGTYTVRTRPEGPLVTSDGSPPYYPAYRVRSYGVAHGAVVGIEVVVLRQSSGALARAIFAVTDAQLGGSPYTDSWNSDVTVAYAQATKGSHGDLGSDGPISMTGGGGSIHGTLEPYANVDLPPPDVPPVSPIAVPLGNVRASETVTSESVVISSIDLSGGKTLTFQPAPGMVQEVWITGSVKVTGSSKIVIQQPTGSTGTVRFYMTGTSPVNFGGNGIVNASPGTRPANLEILSATTTPMTFSGTSSLVGVVYAPKAPLVFNGTPDLYGAAVGDTIVSKGNVGFHYDESLGHTPIRLMPVYKTARLIDVAAGTALAGE